MTYLYRVQMPGDTTTWKVKWETTVAAADKLGKEMGPAYVDKVHFNKLNEDLCDLLNLAESNRETLAQQFHVELVRKWPERDKT